MLTDFGKLCRKIRIDHDQILADMADELNVSAAFLSAVENGKKNPPAEWLNIIRKAYQLEDQEYTKLQQAYVNSFNQVKINLESMNNNDRKTVMAFARRFEQLGKADKEKISKILTEE